MEGRAVARNGPLPKAGKVELNLQTRDGYQTVMADPTRILDWDETLVGTRHEREKTRGRLGGGAGTSAGSTADVAARGDYGAPLGKAK